LFLGKSTPAIRAKIFLHFALFAGALPPKKGLTLPLLVLLGLARYPDNALALEYFAITAHFLD